MNSIYGIRPLTGKVAFVTGANGISGSAIVDYLVKQPANEWTEIIITSRSPIKTVYTDPRVRFVAIDFLEPAEAIVEKLKELCKDVTHAFYTSYIHNNDFSQLYKKNGPLFRTFIEAVDFACPKLQRVVLQTGGKVSRICHISPVSGHRISLTAGSIMGSNSGTLQPPCWRIFLATKALKTSSTTSRKMTSLLFKDAATPGATTSSALWPSLATVANHANLSLIPADLGINETLPLAQYFLICRELGDAPRWPGNLQSYHRVEKQSSAPGIANLTVWAATQPHCKNEVFNHDDGDVIVWKFLWHLLASYFQAPMDKFEAPTETTQSFDLAEWAQDKKPVWERIVTKYGGDPEAFQLDAFRLMNWYITPAPNMVPFISTVAKARHFGWNHGDDTYQSWLNTMRAYEDAGVLPILP
ncbi:hypothetical protein M747DRAFT_357323 [Aspergillus niger ATCC 13496]|uniref:Contig An01c0340, genomic contig n=3 Tax=Aspergillus niger TaxID=5061 RepID=A2QAH4_ASPNC|nr:uncharacterized protein An01g11530 [Aspergillus niger]RDH16808.1 hypothetical protein M747DRAFT_357323 [Aspergillus niger ATCC 13496]CAK44055.1 unnamed protein product [Aspergillus niger]